MNKLRKIYYAQQQEIAQLKQEYLAKKLGQEVPTQYKFKFAPATMDEAIEDIKERFSEMRRMILDLKEALLFRFKE